MLYEFPALVGYVLECFADLDRWKISARLKFELVRSGYVPDH